MTEPAPPTLTDRLHRALSRTTTSGRVVAELEGLRFLAIAGVLLFHLGLVVNDHRPELASAADHATLSAWLNQGRYGVQLFFVISGFVLALPSAERALEGRPGISLRDYFLRRVTRLEPPYILNLLAMYALRMAQGVILPLPVLLASMFYVHNVVYGDVSGVNYVAWSLEVEVQFYVLAPLAMLIFRVESTWARRLALVAFIAANSGWQAAFVRAEDVRILYSLLYHASFFAVGLLLCDLYLVTWRRAPTRSWAWDVAGAGALVAVLSMPLWLGDWTGVRLALPWALFLLATAGFKGPAFNALLRNRWLMVIGGMCYTLYLYHSPLMSLGARFTSSLDAGPSFGANVLLQGALLLPFAVTGASVLFVLFEKPFMAWRLPRRPAPSEAAPAAQG